MRKIISLFLCFVLTLSLVGYQLHTHHDCHDPIISSEQSIGNFHIDKDTSPERCYYCISHSNHHLAQSVLNYNQYQTQEIFSGDNIYEAFIASIPETRSTRAPPYIS